MTSLSVVVQKVKRLSAMRKTRIRSLGQEDLREKEMATQSSSLAWKIPWKRSLASYGSMGLQRIGHDEEIQPVHSEGDQPWDFFGRNDDRLTLQYFGHLMRRVDSLEKTLMLGGIGGRRRRGRQRMMAGWHH